MRIIWNCTKFLTNRQWDIEVLGGFHALPHVRGSEKCVVTVVAHGRDRITVLVYKRA